ncbi:MAG: putative entry exclusion protein TrbK-alt [Devosia sp.]|uniref:putative entry exclusion protein TrbK-alt n=1 Tax=Devosia sp. TaxID=1871048 RepID=UPI001A4A77B6|nr:putative entry exclusion protein TrbK-alt [Devosia sp.]MBL8598918.1 putative entry exclusion protein TrbK-alt [Devosia sp.]
MDGWAFVRLAAVIIVAVGPTAAAIHIARESAPANTSSSVSTTSEAPRTDPLRATLQRCRELGEAATRDVDCLAAWDENRQRFLSPTGGN